MDSLDNIDIDAELDRALDGWLTKDAAELGIDPENPYGNEMSMIMEFKENPTPETFSKLYQSHQPLIFAAGRRFYQSAQIPKTAVASNMTKNYITALNDYDPSKGRAFSSHLYQWMGRTGRYLQRYSNVGRIPENRVWLIDLLDRREATLTEMLGRPPSDTELSDDVMMAANDIADLKHRKISPKMVSTLREELRKDHLAEARMEPTAAFEDSNLRRQIVFLHGSLSGEQQVVLEHTFEGFSKPVIEDAEQLAKKINMSGQKVRAIRRQIQRKVERFYRKAERI